MCKMKLYFRVNAHDYYPDVERVDESKKPARANHASSSAAFLLPAWLTRVACCRFTSIQKVYLASE